MMPIDKNLLAGQFEGAEMPFWLLDSRLDVISVNRCARELFPDNCLADGIRILLSPSESDEVTQSVFGEAGIIKHASVTTGQLGALSFSPYVTPEGERGAFALMLQPPERYGDSTLHDLRRSLENASNLIVTQGLRRCMGDVFFALASCSGALKHAGIGIVNEQLEQINLSCYRVMRTANNLSEKIKLGSRISSAAKATDFWGSCAELLEASETLLRGEYRSFSYKLPESTVFVNCDFDRISTAIINLVANGFLYGGEGVRLSVTGRDLSDRVMLSIADNGPGLPQNIQERLFQPFCSWDSLELNNAGAGLGLHLVRGIVAAAGGSVTVQSDKSGTVVAMTLPTCLPPDRPVELHESSATYMQDRFSPLYFGLCDVVAPPAL